MLGPVVIIAEHPETDLADMLGRAGAFPIVEATFADAAAAIAEIEPAALVVADAGPWPAGRVGNTLVKTIETRDGPFMPVLVRLNAESEAVIVHALPFVAGEPPNRLIARLRSALRVRKLHLTVLRRSGGTPAVLLDVKSFTDRA